MDGKKLTDREIMQRAIELAHNCKSEQGKNSPKVAAIVARDGIILGEGYRGEIESGHHAEFTVLEMKLADKDLTGATLFTTLEPCTRRGKNKTPCADRIIGRKIGKVVFGIIDRNPAIQGNGWWKILEAGIGIEQCETDLATQIAEMNREFLNPFRNRTESEMKDPVQVGEVGINGFPIGYDEEGNKVEWIEEDGEKWAMILRRSDNSIAEVLDEITDKVWYVRKLIMFEKMARGEEERRPEMEHFFQAAIKKMKEMEEKYGGRENLVYDDFEWGFLQGKMSALRWVFGDDWESSLDI
jgi:pyrimidine deaminase RibD-like protein